MGDDLLLVRGRDEPGTINLAIGDAEFLRERFRASYLYERPYGDGVGYPPWAATSGLESAIRRHLGLTTGQYVVVANGGKQALLAAFVAFGERKLLQQLRQPHQIHCRAPYWLSYPTLARIAGATFVSERTASSIDVLTSPNNPDGSLGDLDSNYDIWDAAYASEVYGWGGQRPNHQVGVWSLAKEFGLSGARVGWAVTSDEALARSMAAYVEKTTSGVCTGAQAQAAGVLDFAATDKGERLLREARTHLLGVGQSFISILGPYCDYVAGLPASGRGMFAWFRVLNPKRFAEALAASGVKLIDGVQCGVVERGWYRMALGSLMAVPGMTALAKALK